MDGAFTPAIDLRAEQRRVDLWSLQQARAGLADAIAKGLPFSTEMYRADVARLENRISSQTGDNHAT